MRNLKTSKLSFFALFLVACTTAPTQQSDTKSQPPQPDYQLVRNSNGSAQFIVAPERVVLQCEFLFKEHRVAFYGFMIHILDEENTVVTVAQGNKLGKKDCFNYLNKITKLLSRGRSIYINAYGSMGEPKVVEKWAYTFPKLGTFHGNGRTAQFGSILNEHGDCFDSSNGDKKPCPSE